MAESDSERYEFDAPSHVVNFKELLDSACDDQWFEKQTCPEFTPLKSEPPTSGALEAAAEPPTSGALEAAAEPPTSGALEAAAEPPTSGALENVVSPLVQVAQDSGPGASAPPSNLVASWGAESRTGAGGKRSHTDLDSAQPRRVSKRQTAGGPSAPPSKKRKEHSTSEERELQRIKTLQRKVALHRKKNEASFKAALAGKPPPKKTVPSTTVPKHFHFSTDERVKASASSGSAHTEPDFCRQLRKRCSPAKARRGATVPKPFKLSGGARQKVEEPSAFVSMAQQIQQYERRTPPRYHLLSRHAQERGPSPERGEHLKLTHPQSPHLMTLRRSRHPAVKSSAEQEAEEAEKLKKFKFKAVELNRKILEGAEPLKKPAVKEPTVPESFELEIERRLQERQSTKKPLEGQGGYNFRARPLPRDVLEGVQGVPEKKTAPPTVPESPAFALKKRVRVERSVEVKQPSPVKTRPLAHGGVPFQPRLPENVPVQVCPFSFEQRERERLALKEQRQKEQQQKEEVVQFKAQPLPDFDTVQLPEKRRVEPTRPEPFRLLLDHRGAVKTSRWEQMVKEEQKLQQEAAAFRARPNTVVHKEPFRPRREERPALEVQSFQLATERRARDWEELERLAGEREVQKLRHEEARRQQEEQRQQEEVLRLRQEQVHKAQPVRHYKPVSVKKSEVPLTVPESPNFSDRFRL